MSEAILTISNLEISFSSKAEAAKAVDNISFSLQRGQTLALVGESGSGKSMTALAVMQLLPLGALLGQQSVIDLEGTDLLLQPETVLRKIRGRRVGMIFQEALTALNSVLTIGQQINEVLRCHFTYSKKQCRQRMLQYLEKVGINDPEHCAASYPHQLSGGMRQRAMIAMALSGEPDLLIADEPTTALDVTIQAQVLELLKTIQQETGMSLLFITHDLAIVRKMADYVVVMKKGKVVEEGEVNEFFANAQHAYTQQLFDAIPTWEMRGDRKLINGNEKMLINVDGLKIHFPIKKGVFKRTVGHIKAVDGVSFTLKHGRTLALVGESGSGKTTTGRGILQLLKITAGHVHYEQQELNKLSSMKLRPLRQELQIIFQDPYSSMNPRMLVRDIIAEGMLAQRIKKNAAERQARIDELLHLVDLDIDCQWRYPHEFSGGQRQRICIARTLAMDPKFIICDEPTSALDVSVQMQILKLLMKLQDELGLSYLLITHNLGVVAYMADEVAVMYQGKIVEQGSAEQILHAPQHEYTQRLLASVPTI